MDATRFQVVIIGSGFAGISAAIQLRRIGISDLIILERDAKMGGTWVQNTYPGAAVDVQSPLYSLSDEPYEWSQMFAEQAEIEQYTQHIIDRHALKNVCHNNVTVTGIHWQTSEQEWKILTQDTTYFAKFVINCTGALSRAVIPEFDGANTFKGHAFHTSRWQHDVDYTNKKVAIIGSGASAAQIIPAIADDVSQLDVYQRTPHWVLPRPDYVFSSWQRKLLKFRWVKRLLRSLIYIGLECRVVGFKYSDIALDIIAGKKARSHLKNVSDPILRQKLTPNYTIGCKRIILSSTLFPALNRDNVSLLDASLGIKALTAKGIMTKDGVERDYDVIVYSTGFDATDGMISYPVVGKFEQTLEQSWRDFPRAYLGTTVPGFPNLFLVAGPNTGIGHTSAIFIIESQMRYITSCIKSTLDKGASSIEVKASAESAYTEKVHQSMVGTVWAAGGCNSWYKSKSGKISALFPGFSFSFRYATRRCKPQEHEYTYPTEQ